MNMLFGFISWVVSYVVFIHLRFISAHDSKKTWKEMHKKQYRLFMVGAKEDSIIISTLTHFPSFCPIYSLRNFTINFYDIHFAINYY